MSLLKVSPSYFDIKNTLLFKMCSRTITIQLPVKSSCYSAIVVKPMWTFVTDFSRHSIETRLSIPPWYYSSFIFNSKLIQILMEGF